MPSFQNESRLQGKIKMIPFKLKWKYHRSYIINFAFLSSPKNRTAMTNIKI